MFEKPCGFWLSKRPVCDSTASNHRNSVCLEDSHTPIPVQKVQFYTNGGEVQIKKHAPSQSQNTGQIIVHMYHVDYGLLF